MAEDGPTGTGWNYRQELSSLGADGLDLQVQVSNGASSQGGWDDTFYLLFQILHFSAAPYPKRLTCMDCIDGSQTFGSQDSHMINY